MLFLATFSIAYSIYFKGIFQDFLVENMSLAILIVMMFITGVFYLVFLDKNCSKLWGVILAGLTSFGIVILGFQNGVFWGYFEWTVSHFYYGLIGSILMASETLRKMSLTLAMSL